MEYIIPILFVALLCAGWVAVQMIAKKMKTKNHFDHLNNACGNCTCGGAEDACESES
jgi:hypothetical protein